MSDQQDGSKIACDQHDASKNIHQDVDIDSRSMGVGDSQLHHCASWESLSEKSMLPERNQATSLLPTFGTVKEVTRLPSTSVERKNNQEEIDDLDELSSAPLATLTTELEREQVAHPDSHQELPARTFSPPSYANRPHPSLEYPPLYFLLKSYCPRLFSNIRGAYAWRWKMSYPLQARVPLSRQLRKMRIHLTWGELLCMTCFLTVMSVGLLYTAVYPSVIVTGMICRAALIAALVLAQRNSLVTLLIGLPVDRSAFYHKLTGHAAFVAGFMHAVAFYLTSHHRDMRQRRIEGQVMNHFDADDYIDVEGGTWNAIMSNRTEGQTSGMNNALSNRGGTLWQGSVCVAGSVMFTLITILLLTSLPVIRRRLFEFFYIVHLIGVVGIVVGAMFHTGILIPVIALATWGVDLVLRQIVMARYRYPREATLQVISESVVQISFPKTKGFDYNPGQYIYIALPGISWLEWHPFSISSSPKQRNVTLHVRRAGDWTNALHELAQMVTTVPILIEGPYGNLGVDLLVGDRYKMILLVSGGIGITPMQSICDQLLHEQAKGRRTLKRLRFVWTERDPVVMRQTEFVRRADFVSQRSVSTWHMQSTMQPDHTKTNMDDSPRLGGSSSMATRLLTIFPPGQDTDQDLDRFYASAEVSLEHDLVSNEDNTSNKEDDVAERGPNGDSDIESNSSEETSIASEDPENPWERSNGIQKSNSNRSLSTHNIEDVLDLQVYSSSADLPPNAAPAAAATTSLASHVHMGRPPIRELFDQMKEEAVACGEPRVAVCVCAPSKLVDLCRKACFVYSDKHRGVGKVQFDFHSEPTAL